MRRGRSERVPTSMLFLGLLACSGRESTSSPRPLPATTVAPALDAGHGDPVALVAECQGAIERIHDRLVDGAHLTVDEKRAPAAACAKLYRRKRCADAWLAAPGGGAPDVMSRVIAECAAAYCPSLADRSLTVCSGLARDAHQRYLDFAALTHAVLELEWGSAEAQRMSAHLLELSTPVLTIEAGWVVLDGAKVVRLADFPKDDWRVPVLLEALRNRASGEFGTDIYFRLPEQTGTPEINVLVSSARAAGYERVLFCVARDEPRDEPRDDCRPLRLNR